MSHKCFVLNCMAAFGVAAFMAGCKKSLSETPQQHTPAPADMLPSERVSQMTPQAQPTAAQLHVKPAATASTDLNEDASAAGTPAKNQQLPNVEPDNSKSSTNTSGSSSPPMIVPTSQSRLVEAGMDVETGIPPNSEKGEQNPASDAALEEKDADVDALWETGVFQPRVFQPEEKEGALVYQVTNDDTLNSVQPKFREIVKEWSRQGCFIADRNSRESLKLTDSILNPSTENSGFNVDDPILFPFIPSFMNPSNRHGRSNKEMTGLQLAMWHGDSDFVKFWVANGADTAPYPPLERIMLNKNFARKVFG